MTLTNHHINDLLEHCKSNNHQAQMEVYNRYYKAMYNISFRIVKDSFKAEDIMQESFLTAFTKLDTLKDPSIFGSWLKRIVINNSLNHYQNLKKNDNVPLDAVIYKVEDPPDMSENEDWNNLKAAQILECMNNLKDNYRISLTLFLIEGYDYEEIGEIMNISYANCRTMISRAKESLRQKLETSAAF